jgi:uncharacterized membrane protein YhfC
MLYTFPIAILIEIGLPIALAIWATRRFRTSWKLVGIGVLTFIGSQVVHIPLLYGLTALFQQGILPTPPMQYQLAFNAVVLGLAAGICEETARWIGYRALKDKARRFAASITLGIGHGGIESALFVGASVLASFIYMLVLRSGDPQMLNPQVAAYFSTPWYLPLVGALERVMAIVLHITLSVIVWLSIVKKNGWIFWGAVLYHALVDGLTVAMSGLGMSNFAIEGALGVFTILNAVFLVWMWKRAKASEEAEAAEATETAEAESAIPEETEDPILPPEIKDLPTE